MMSRRRPQRALRHDTSATSMYAWYRLASLPRLYFRYYFCLVICSGLMIILRQVRIIILMVSSSLSRLTIAPQRTPRACWS